MLSVRRTHLSTESTSSAPVPPRPSRPLTYPPVVEERPSSRPVILAAAAVVVALAAIGVVLVYIGRSDGESAQGARQAPSTVVGSTTSSAAPTVSSVVTFGAGRVLTATQHVVFPRPVDSLTVTVPRQFTRVGGGMFNPKIASLEVRLGDNAPIAVSGPLRPGNDVTIPLPSPQTELDLAYRTSGAVRISKPSSSHRAAALVTTLIVSPAHGSSSVAVQGSNITNIGCFLADGTAQSCGSQTSDGWIVMRESGSPDMAIIAQLDLEP